MVTKFLDIFGISFPSEEFNKNFGVSFNGHSSSATFLTNEEDGENRKEILLRKNLTLLRVNRVCLSLHLALPEPKIYKVV